MPRGSNGIVVFCASRPVGIPIYPTPPRHPALRALTWRSQYTSQLLHIVRVWGQCDSCFYTNFFLFEFVFQVWQYGGKLFVTSRRPEQKLDCKPLPYSASTFFRGRILI